MSIYSHNTYKQYDKDISYKKYDTETHHNYTHITRKLHNHYMRSVNGNITNINHINLMQYNKGSSNYATKEHFLNKIITDNNIDIGIASLCLASICFSFTIKGYPCVINLKKKGISCQKHGLV